MFEELEAFFLVHEYSWRIGGDLKSPTADDFKAVYEEVRKRLADEPEHTQLEVGHLIFKKREGFIDVFVHFGEIDL